MSYTREQIEAAMRDAAECGPTQSAMLRQLLAENDALWADAERYRFLRSGWIYDFRHKAGMPLDQAIDAARKKD